VTATDHSDLIAALLGVPGVAAAAVEPLGDGPGTLRLQLAPGVDEVGVAGEVNRLLRSRFGLAVDTDRVRVIEEDAQQAGEPPADVRPEAPVPPRDEGAAPSPLPDRGPGGGPPPDHAVKSAAEQTAESTEPTEPTEPEANEVAGRLVVERVQLVSAGLATSVIVSLSSGQRAFEGAAEGTSTADSLNRAVAVATLRAVEAFVPGVARFDLDHVEVTETGTDRTAVVVVTMVTERASQRLAGASVVRDDTGQGVIRAVLAAVNRRLGAVVVQEGAER